MAYFLRGGLRTQAVTLCSDIPRVLFTKIVQNGGLGPILARKDLALEGQQKNCPNEKENGPQYDMHDQDMEEKKVSCIPRGIGNVIRGH